MKSHTRDRYIFYRDRPEWADVTPVPQDEGGRNVVKIAYSPQSIDANDYLRAVLLKDERSERALSVTTTVLLLNPANYTVWEYRRRILESLASDLNEELAFVSQLIDEHSKNYQLWHHRQWIVSKLSETVDPSKRLDPQHWGVGELEFTDSIITDDSKNYHAWQHRRWAVTHFKMPVDGELRYTESLIQEDMYNNSAWNHRFVVVTHDEGLTPMILEREVEFVQQVIRKGPNNESAWNYLYGLLVPMPCVTSASQLGSSASSVSTRPDLSSFTTHVGVVDETKPTVTHSVPDITVSTTNLQRMRQFAEDLASSDAVASNSVALLGFLVEVYTDCLQTRIRQAKIRNSQSHSPQINAAKLKERDGNSNEGSESPQEESLSELLELALSTCDKLATEIDRIRANYWHYRSRQLVAIGKEAGLEI